MIPINFKEIESGVIFEKHTIDEINGIEKRIRQEIDKKKEELRQMVGQRYRELIEAADTITDMKNGSEKVLESIQKLQKLCQNLKEKSSSLSSKQPVSNLTEEEMTHRSNSACLKILLELPSKIWCHMDDNEYLESSRIYLLGQHIHAHLCSGMDEQLIGLVVKHWGNVGHLKKVIIKNAEDILKDVAASDKLVVDCLCTLSLLVNKPLDVVFKEFLDIRIQQFNSVAPSSNGSSAGLSSNGSSSGSGGGGNSNSSRDVQSIKPLICDIVDNFTSTLRQIHYLFFAPVSNDGRNGNGANFEMDNLFSRTLMNCLNKDSSDFIKKSEILSEQAINLLPKRVLNFKPTVKSELKPLEKDFVKNETKKFVEKSTRSVNSGFSSLFEYIVNITSLASTRRDVITVIKKNCKKCDWPKICDDVIGHDLDIWKEFLKGHFIKRMKTLIEQHVSSILSSTKTDISDTLNRAFHAKSNKPTSSSSTTTTSMFERDISTYIWLEGKTDIDLSIIWGGPVRSSASGSSGSSSSGLAMKAKGYTPEIQSLNHSLNSKLRSLLDEVASYASQSEKASLTAATPTSSSNHFLFRNDNPDNDDDSSLDKNSDDADDDMSKVQELLRTTCEKFAIELMEFMFEQVSSSEEKLNNNNNNKNTYDVNNNNNSASTTDDDDDLIPLYKIIFIGRWASSLSETCPSLKSSMTEVDAAAAASDVIVTSSSIPKLLNKTVANVKPTTTTTNNNNDNIWSNVLERIDSFCQRVYMVWSNHIVTMLTGQLKRSLMTSLHRPINGFLSNCTQWETIMVDEENEEGKVVKSCIKIPMQASWNVQNVLYALCTHINKVGGHVMHRSILNSLTTSLLDNILSIYLELLSSKPPLPPSSSSAAAAPTSSLPSSSSRNDVIPQNYALQMWFDVKYLSNLLACVDETRSSSSSSSLTTTANKVTETLEAIESMVDPFDFDVFKSYLLRNTNKQMQKTYILYGLALGPERSSLSSFPSSFLTSSSSSSGGQHDQHHVAYLSDVSGRFPLLPIPHTASKQYQSNLEHKAAMNSRQAATMTSATTNSNNIVDANNSNIKTSSFTSSFPSSSSSSSLPQAPPPPPRAGSSSFLEEMSRLFGSGGSANALYNK